MADKKFKILARSRKGSEHMLTTLSKILSKAKTKATPNTRGVGGVQNRAKMSSKNLRDLESEEFPSRCR